MTWNRLTDPNLATAKAGRRRRGEQAPRRRPPSRPSGPASATVPRASRRRRGMGWGCPATLCEDRRMAEPGHQLPVVALVGPTAVGKSELSLSLAEALGGEVVNTDSMQLYRGMDIGTAKLPVTERRGVPHHLLDVLDVTEPASVAEFQGWARAVIADCRARGV